MAHQTTPQEIDLSPLSPIVAALEVDPNTPGDHGGFIPAELSRLTEAVSADNLAVWRRLPREAQRGLVGLVTARARHIQDERGGSDLEGKLRDQLDALFSVLTSYSKREQPGFIYGLQRSHRPVARTWWDDARRWWCSLADLVPEGPGRNPERALDSLAELLNGEPSDDQVEAALLAALEADVQPDDPRLVELAKDQTEVLQRKARFKRLRRAVRAAAEEDEASEEDLAAHSSAPPPDWRHWNKVKGKQAVVVGGDARDHARRRILETFQFESLDWVETDHSRKLQALRDAIESGRYDLVIVLRRFIGHDVDRIVLPACKAADVAWASVDHGYGITQVRQALERYLGQAGPRV